MPLNFDFLKETSTCGQSCTIIKIHSNWNAINQSTYKFNRLERPPLECSPYHVEAAFPVIAKLTCLKTFERVMSVFTACLEAESLQAANSRKKYHSQTILKR